MTHSDGRSGTYEPIAIVGIGCRFPGGIISPQTFWDFLMRAGDGTSEVPEDRWNVEKHYDPERGKPGKLYTRRGGFIDNVRGFDPQFFGISPREAAYMDPQQRLLLETAWEAFEDAGITPPRLERHKVGVFVGLFTHDYENLHQRTSEYHLQSSHSATGMSTTIAANRLSYAFDFMGPSMIIDTACSSSLVAAHLACRALQSGEAEIAIAGGVNLQLSPEMTMALCNASMLAPDGRCKTFDSRANGYARADGVGVVVLKPLSRAVADGDAVYAVIHGSAVNQDGHSSGLTVPNGDAQIVVMGDALKQAGLKGSDVTYVEAHGTGTPVGDPIEANALATVLTADKPDRAPCVIGSVKSNFGHTESAAGVAGLIKVALMQHHGRIPANLNLETPNPKISFEDLRIRVLQDSEDWPVGEDGRRFAGVNSFGFGGTNAHLVIGRSPEAAPVTPTNGNQHGATVLALSARSRPALVDTATRMAHFLSRDPAPDLSETAAALALARTHHVERLVLAAESREAAVALLDGFVEGTRQFGLVSGTAKPQGRLAFVCSGMGQQWWAMGRGLMAGEPVFAAKVAEIDALFARLSDDRSLAELFAMDEESSEINRTQYAQRAIFAVQVGLAALWESVGIHPDFVVGHSVGEVAASHIAGALSLPDAVLTSFHRSRLQATLAGRGGMLAIGLPEDEVRPYLDGIGDKVSMGAVNSPGSVTLAGDVTELERLLAHFEQKQIFARMLNVEVPYHSPVMDEIGDAFRAALHTIDPHETRIPLVSTVTGKLISGAELTPDYWVHNTREAVSFRKAMGVLAAEGCTSFIEIGAHPVLATSINECLAADKVEGTAIASLRRKQDDILAFWSAFGQLHCIGHDAPFEVLFRRTGKRIGLPTYAWQNAEYWMESAESHRNRTGRDADDAPKPHSLLSERQTAPQPTWRAGIAPERPAYLKDHRVDGSVVFPAAGYVEAALAAIRAGSGDKAALVLEDFVIEAPLILDGAHAVELQTRIDADGRIEIHSLSGKPGDHYWMRHARARVIASGSTDAPAPIDVAALQASLSAPEDAEAFYGRFAELDLDYGPRFRNIEAAFVGVEQVLGRFRMPDDAEAELGDYLLHPALLDTAFQLVAGLSDKGTYLPVGFDRVTVFHPGQRIAYAHVTPAGRTRTRIRADIAVTDENGAIVALISGLTLKLFDSSDRSVRMAEDDYLYEQSWVEEPLDAGAGQVCERFTDLDALAAHLLQRHVERDREDLHFRNLVTALPELDALALGYFAQGLERLGFVWAPGRLVSVPQLVETLGILPRHDKFLARMLRLLEKAGHVAAEGAGWRIGKAPAVDTLKTHWRDLVARYPDHHAELVILQRCGGRLDRFLTGADDPLFALFPNDCPFTEHLYADSPTCGPYNRIIQDLVRDLVARLQPGEKLRILEVGAGTGGLAAHVIPQLPPERVAYVYTDLSEHFLSLARTRFGAHGGVSFKKLDIGSDPVAQGFAEGSFDLVLAGDVIHAVPDLAEVLGNVRGLLKPGGALAMLEITAPAAWFDLVFGLLPGWWAFTDKRLRAEHATLPVPAWLGALKTAGFDAACPVIDAVAGAPGQQNVLLARKPTAPVETVSSVPMSVDGAGHPIVLLERAKGSADALAEALTKLGAIVRIETVGEADAGFSADQLGLGGEASVVVDLRGRAPGDTALAPSEAATRLCVALQQTLLALADRPQGRSTLWLVTSGGEALGDAAQAPDLTAAAVRGFARTAMNEHGEVDTRLVDLSLDPGSEEIEALARQILSDSPETEIALRGRTRFVGRVHRWRRKRAVGAEQTAYALRRSSWPAPNDLVFQQVVPPAPGPGEVQVRVAATGVNFKDYALLAGLVGEEAGELGIEAAGTVLSVGPNVTGFAPGDRVYGLAANGFDAVINIGTDALAIMPKHLSFEEAAGIPVVFLSAYHALAKQAGLGAGQTVLIHTAASGLGLAAIGVARALGARILATAGTDEKRAYLEALGIEYVGNSRNTDFAREVTAFLDGAGVDVVLNTLSAELNAANFALLKSGTGRLIDVANIHYETQLDLRAFARGISVSGFDLYLLGKSNPGYVRTLLAKLTDLFDRGVLKPLPYRSVSIERVSEVIQSMRKATHIGKLVVSHNDARLNILPGEQSLRLKPDAAYLITGGLTGFGLATAKWLAENGARHLVLAGRRGAATPEAQPVLDILRAAGVDVHAVACDVARREDVAALVSRFGADLPPLAGVIHGAMVLRDGPLRRMSADDMRAVLAPKIDGAVHLDELTRDLELDFFICDSSISSLAGNRDQANYAAANRALEVLMTARRARGQAGLAIGWGVLGEIGLVARDAAIREVFERQGIYPLAPDKAWIAMALGIQEQAAYLGAVVVDWRKLGKFTRIVAGTPRFALVNGMGRAGADTSEAGEGDMAAEGAAADMTTAVVRDIAGVLGMKPDTVDVNKPLPELGFDSLMAVELSVALEHSTGHSFNRMSLLRPDLTAAELIAVIESELGEGGGNGAGAATPGHAEPSEAVDVANMSDAEVDAMLRQLSAGE